MENINESLGINEENKSNEQNTSSGFSDYFSFRKMISLTFIQIIYVIGIIAIIIAGIRMISEGSNSRYGGEEMILGGIGILTLGNIVWRVICEAWILFFRIAASVSNIEKNCKK
jgi:hypothetical protein